MVEKLRVEDIKPLRLKWDHVLPVTENIIRLLEIIYPKAIHPEDLWYGMFMGSLQVRPNSGSFASTFSYLVRTGKIDFVVENGIRYYRAKGSVNDG